MEVDPVSRCALSAISEFISRLNKPNIIANVQWGELLKSEAGRKIKDNFIGDFIDFCNFLSSKFTHNQISTEQLNNIIRIIIIIFNYYKQ